MGNQQYHHRFARVAGHLCWSIPGAAGTLHIPWTDVLGSGGRLDRDHLSTLLTALRQFEAEISALGENATWPPLPTPNAKLIYRDNTAFERELADRLVVYKKRITRTTGSADD
jgi:hypothetical protein